MLIGTSYHFVPLSLTLTLLGGHKVSAKQNLLALFSHKLFIDQDETWYSDQALVEYPDTTFEWHLVKWGKYMLF